MDRYDELKQIFDEVEEDFIRFFEFGNKSAGVRIRKNMMCLKEIAQDVREEVIRERKS